jgi:hypothetical protein
VGALVGRLPTPNSVKCSVSQITLVEVKLFIVRPLDAQSPRVSLKYRQPGDTNAVEVGMVTSTGSALKSISILFPFASTNSTLIDCSIEYSPSGSSNGVARDATVRVTSVRLVNSAGRVDGIWKEMVSPFVLVMD